jgi:hypothetical protein
VSLADRELVVENGKVRIEVECLLGSLERTGSLTLILPGRRRRSSPKATSAATVSAR